MPETVTFDVVISRPLADAFTVPPLMYIGRVTATLFEPIVYVQPVRSSRPPLGVPFTRT